jgi:hypothetical protein
MMQCGKFSAAFGLGPQSQQWLLSGDASLLPLRFARWRWHSKF